MFNENTVNMDNQNVVTSYKAFLPDWSCAPVPTARVQYKVGKTYEYDGEISVCDSGFHACTYPLDVFKYYFVPGAKFAVVEQSGELSFDSPLRSTKVASSKIYIKEELTSYQMIQKAIEWLKDKLNKPDKRPTVAFSEGKKSCAVATYKDRMALAQGQTATSVATSDSGSAVAEGEGAISVSTGLYSTSCSLGEGSIAVSSSVGSAVIASGVRNLAGSAADFNRVSVIADHAAAISTGRYGRVYADGKESVAVSAGHAGRVAGKIGCVLVAVERTYHGTILSYAIGTVGKDGLKPDTWYLCKDGRFVECKEE